ELVSQARAVLTIASAMLEALTMSFERGCV
ncbi:MAG: hypothetical protein H6Q08_136, partial [Acidobacteria bacterium]|nr:hypothetical protein [Acidobacteriota bacterium]